MTETSTPAPIFSSMTRKQLAAILADSDIAIGTYRAAEKDLCIRVWLRSDKTFLVRCATTRSARGNL